MGRLIAIFMLTTAVGLVGYHLPTQESAPTAAAGVPSAFREAATQATSASVSDTAARTTTHAKPQSPGLTPMEKLRAAALANRNGEAHSPEKAATHAPLSITEPAVVAAAKRLGGATESRLSSSPQATSADQPDNSGPHARIAPRKQRLEDQTSEQSWTASQRTVALTIPPAMGGPVTTATMTTATVSAPTSLAVPVPEPVEVRASDMAMNTEASNVPSSTATGRAVQRFVPPAHLGASAAPSSRSADQTDRTRRRAFNTRQFWENSVQRGL